MEHDTYKSHEEENLNRSRQLTSNSRCLKPTSSHQVPSVEDDIEEVIYSQGEPYQAEPYNSSWESDDDMEQDNRPNRRSTKVMNRTT